MHEQQHLTDTARFALETRLFVLMKRVMSRSIDLDYLQRSPDYLADVLRHADSAVDTELRELSARLRPSRPAAANTPPEPAAKPRYVATLR